MGDCWFRGVSVRVNSRKADAARYILFGGEGARFIRGGGSVIHAASNANGLAHEDLRKRRLLYPFQTASRTRTCESTGCCIRCQRSRARGLARAQSAVSAANGLAHKGLRMSKMLSSLPTASRARTSESAGCCIRCQRSRAERTSKSAGCCMHCQRPRARGLPKAQDSVSVANGLAHEVMGWFCRNAVAIVALRFSTPPPSVGGIGSRQQKQRFWCTCVLQLPSVWSKENSNSN